MQPAAEVPPLAEPELDVDALRRRARLGVIALVARTVVLQLVVGVAQIALARLLSPTDFGAFAIVQFALSFFAFFGDAGFGAALIQQKDEPSQRELSSVFFAQILLSVAAISVVALAAEAVRLVWPSLPSSSTWLVRVLSLDLLLTVLRVVPSILLERQLRFGRLAVLEIVHTLGFYGAAVALAARGLHVWALVAAVLVQGVVGVVTAFAMRPWRPSLVFDREALRPVIRFGLPYQLKNAIGFVNGAVTPLYAGAKLGERTVGFVNFAQTTAYFPLKLVEIMGRVTFPLYSRVRDRHELFAETLGRSIQICAMGTFAFIALFLGLGPALIHVVYDDKWMPALPLLYVFSIVISIGFLSPLVASALDAIGRPEIVARLAVGWTMLNWLIVPFAARYGMLGFTVGYSVHVVVGNLAVVYVLGRLVPGVRVLRRLAPSFVAAAFATTFARGVAAPWVPIGSSDRLSIAGGFIGATGAVLLAYAGVLLLMDRRGAIDALSIVPGQKNSLEKIA